MAETLFPALFIGHGSPMNAVAHNSYTEDLARAASELPEPRCILVISAHWHSREPLVTGSPEPEQIYDFYGFPGDLYDLQYRAPGSPEMAGLISELSGGRIGIDPVRGIDHAAWAVLIHMFPEQRIPVLEMSIDYNSDPEFCIDMGRELRSLRREGILIIGSGNLVHNLQLMKYDESAEPYIWAAEFDLNLKERLIIRDRGSLSHYLSMGPPAYKSIPTPDHYLPMLYILGLMEEGENLSFIHESIQNGSISMRSFRIG